MKKIYMDYNATSPLLDEVKKTIKESLEIFGNPSSMHDFGRSAREVVENSRKSIAKLINAKPEEIIFTSCGSESNNLVLKGNMCGKKCCSGFIPVSDKHVITSVIEHPSVLNTCKAMESTGTKVSFIKVNSKGLIDMEEFKSEISKKPDLVSIMWANNETGTIQDLDSIVKISHQNGVKVHTDAVQIVGKIPIDVQKTPVDFLSLSGHKIGAPKGIGALYLKKNMKVCPLIHGGHQEGCKRAGTENTIGIAALGKACEVAYNRLESNYEYLKNLRDNLEQQILSKIPNTYVNGDIKERLPHVTNITFKFIEGESILLLLNQYGIAVSTGSACSTGSLEPSHVMLALGLSDEDSHGSIRFSLGMSNTIEDINYVVQCLEKIVTKLRHISPLGK